MATADPLNGGSTAGAKRGFVSDLWNRWKDYRRRARARNLAHVRFRLTREGLHFAGILSFIFIGAVIREISLLILLAGAMIGLLILQWRFNTSTLVGLTLNRILPRSTRVGQDTEIQIQLTNPKSWLSAWLVQSSDSIRKTLPKRNKTPERGVALLDQVRPKGSGTTTYSLKFFERGEYKLGPTVLSTRFPLGLGIGWRTLDNSSSIIVHPKQGTLTNKVSKLWHLEQIGQAKSSSQSGNQEGEFFGLRPWTSGDSKRWIHWRTTARLDELTVRQYEQQQQKQITLILDLHDAKTEGSREIQETAISFVATLASQTVALGQDRLAVGVASDKSQAYPSIVSSLLVQNLLDNLAVIQASEDTDMLATFRGLSVPILTNPQVVVVSTRANMLTRLKSECSDSSTERLLSVARVRWLDVSSGDLEEYFEWI
ncbi:MAG: DUF58 domain-containing protein [Planctomycetota bacterium]